MSKTHLGLPAEQVTGEIPEELNGRFLRVGGNPGPVDPEYPRTYNRFIGSGMVNGRTYAFADAELEQVNGRP